MCTCKFERTALLTYVKVNLSEHCPYQKLLFTNKQWKFSMGRPSRFTLGNYSVNDVCNTLIKQIVYFRGHNHVLKTEHELYWLLINITLEGIEKMKYGTSQPKQSEQLCERGSVDQNTFELSKICILAYEMYLHARQSDNNFSFANGSRDNWKNYKKQGLRN